MQALARHGYISTERTVLDYGCGQGDDVRALRLSGVEAFGWDPHHAPDGTVELADIVNLGFVLNVIETPSERVEVLQHAFALARVCLCVSVITGKPSQAVAQRPYGDGFMSQRGTFQKYYAQDELREFLESALDREAIAVGPGMFFVFPDEVEEQRFFLDRQRRRISLDVVTSRPTQRIAKERLSPNEKYRSVLEPLWQRMLELGRGPDETELTADLLESLRTQVPTLRRAERLCGRMFDSEDLRIAAQRRTDDLVLYFALSQFGRRKAYAHLPVELQRDVKAFFGSLARARDAGRALLFSLGRPDVIAQACRQTAENGIGTLREGDALFLHTALIERLPPQLRCYVACATKLYGDVETADLVKIHIRSGRLSLLYYDDFAVSPTPALRQRIKIDLRTQRISSFDHSQVPSPQVLLMKSRYMTPDQADYDRQRKFDEKLKALGLYVRDDYFPSLNEFTETLRLAGYRPSGFDIVRFRGPAQAIDQVVCLPALEERAGRHFSFSDLCKAGDTFARFLPDNRPTDSATYEALKRLCDIVLDPVVEAFGPIDITYGFSGPRLSRLIGKRIAPRLDQHAGHERNSRDRAICERNGQAADFRVPGIDSKTVADWIVLNTAFDRLYFYGRDRPLHVSVGPQNLRQVIMLRATSSGRRLPRVVSREQFTQSTLG